MPKSWYGVWICFLWGKSAVYLFKTSHTKFHCRLDILDHTHAVHLVKAQSWTYLFLKSKSCGSCAARQAGLFSLSLEFFSFFLFSPPPLSLSLSLSVSPSLSLSVFLSDFSSSLLFSKSSSLIGQACMMMIILFGYNKAQTRTLDLDG